jgi:Na+/H+ antiporter NhaD/arsenite permease-like protein
MLLAIAVLPLVARHWWESNRNKTLVSALLGLPVLLLYLGRDPAALVHAAEEYVSFIVLLGSLYAIAGGIVLRLGVVATPLANTGLLAVGAALASLIGTTGASMLLIRPLLRINQTRAQVWHTVVFFIFIVSNVGGLLTPLGDPPLFLGYLRGVPFAWTFRLWLPWLVTVSLLLAIYFVWDSIQRAREAGPAPAHGDARSAGTLPPADARSPGTAAREAERSPRISVRGAPNALGLGAVVLAVAFLGTPWRELAMAAAAALSFWLTPRALRVENRFTAHPIVEVAVLFVGIFLTMVPALDLLRTHGVALGVREPWQFFWVGGVLSSVLDTAPTYLTFFAMAQGLGLPDEVVGMSHAVLAGLSLGTVFMGANTYIGNAPNFMVKAIAEEAGVPMPTFLGYAVYAAAVLIPVYAGVTFLFLL